MGISKAGFKNQAVIEKDHHSCETLFHNFNRGLGLLSDWQILQADTRTVDFTGYEGSIDLVSGGPPCQPFSLAGNHLGRKDHRNLFPEAVRAIREIKPKAFIFENVKGLLRPGFTDYFEYILLTLTHPEIVKKNNEDWLSHLTRLENHHTSKGSSGLEYNILFRLLNSADFGIPQKRERVFIVGFRSDIDASWSFPIPTHSAEALWNAKWTTGEYWDRHEIASSKRAAPPARITKKLTSLFAPSERPWRTVRDAIKGLPAPGASNSTFSNHNFQDGAKVYPGHTGSPLDEPAKTLKAGDHGVPGGENMMVKDDGSVRYFTVRESARLQTFPDDYEFTVSWTESMRQIGNAVPVELSHRLAMSIRDHLSVH